ncbi:SpoIIE family protein phosphatase [Paenibacillus sp. YYML68]|uniref:SpoIIE family protein phosphatase n=1 Tax=Paenibacillus sp. YYML68 TaxID=2909250 RepID=UPI002490EB9E|nr:SpoIIE family protein phosphatase [Paenibacillus sp. YYML68]
MKHYDKGTLRLIGFASLVIMFSMLLIGAIVNGFTENGVVRKLKEKDLPSIAQGMAAKVDGRIERAKETSLVLAADPDVKEWLLAGEPSDERQRKALQRLSGYVQQLGYSSSFIVSAGTGNYWGENGGLLGKVSRDEPADQWFYRFLSSGEPLQVNLDYNKERQETFVFTNALMMDEARPLAVVGVGMSLVDLAEEFRQFKYGQTSRLWLINEEGFVMLSDRTDDYGKNVTDWLEPSLTGVLLASGNPALQTFELEAAGGALTDLISYPLASTNLRLLFQIERQETVSFLNRIQLNTVGVALISFVLILFLFYYVSHRLVNPFERALQLNEQLERKVQARTRELAEHNAKLTDSIDYARRIQESLLQGAKELPGTVKEHVLIYKPRDGVGGDFHWTKQVEGGTLIAVGDCTGHGVPGALMTMLAVSLLDRVSEQGDGRQPAQLLSQMNVLVKQLLHQSDAQGMTDDGLDLGLCFVAEDGHLLRYAGAKCSLYVREGDGIQVLRGERRAIGYRRTPADYPFRDEELQLLPGTVCYMATDGFFDQNGGEKGLPFGKKRFMETLERVGGLSLQEQSDTLWRELVRYMGEEEQRDDVTLLAFRAS